MPRETRILLVDDEPTILLGLSHVLRGAGAEVTACPSRAGAETAIQNQVFDLAILDVRLSGSETTAGLDLVTKMKQRCPSTRVIVMTAFGTEEIQREAVARGAAAYWDKPIDLEHLVGLVRELREGSSR
jgi:DNA-binding NtrC family response regulator